MRDSLTFKLPTLINIKNDESEVAQFIDLKMGDGFVVLLTARGEVYTMGENTEG